MLPPKRIDSIYAIVFGCFSLLQVNLVHQNNTNGLSFRHKFKPKRQARNDEITFLEFIHDQSLSTIQAKLRDAVNGAFLQMRTINFGASLIDTQDVTVESSSETTELSCIIKERSQAALISLFVTKNLKKNNLEITNEIEKSFHEIQQFCPLKSLQCSISKYRSIDGICNNLQFGYWGASHVAMQRLIGSFYSDNISDIRQTTTGCSLPNAHRVLDAFYARIDSSQLDVDLLFVQWAHFIYSDIVQIDRQVINQDPKQCCNDGVNEECYPVLIEKFDSYQEKSTKCLPYVRTAPAPRPNCGLGPREQINQASSYLDGSMMYGNTMEEAVRIRSFKGGKLLEFSNLLKPESADDGHNSSIKYTFPKNLLQKKFAIGSHALTFLWIRQHNNIADQLSAINPGWDDDRIFEESRRIIIAQLQHITYNEFLPILIGQQVWKDSNLSSEPEGYSYSYSPKTDASAINSYAVAAGQFFITMSDWRFEQIIDADAIDGSLRERQQSNIHLPETNHIIRNLLKQRSRLPGLYGYRDLERSIFEDSRSTEMDIVTLIIQESRDHGIPPYSAWREFCTGDKILSFEDLYDEFTGEEETLRQIKKIYGNVKDVDLLVLGLAEKAMDDSLVGPIFACIIKLQFEKIKSGDRFWYENDIAMSRFTKDQITEIKKTTLAQIICKNLEEIESLQPNAFLAPVDARNYINCNAPIFDGINLMQWSEIRNGEIKPTADRVLSLSLMEVNKLRDMERKKIEQSVGNTMKENLHSAYNKMMQSKIEAVDLSRISDVLLQASKFLVDGYKMDNGETLPLDSDMQTIYRALQRIEITSYLNNITLNKERDGLHEQCLLKTLPCDSRTPYRTMSGWCNNIENPQYANAFGTLLRLLPPAYENGLDVPRSLTETGEFLPSPRVISNAIHFDVLLVHSKYSHMIMQFGQIVDHDMMQTPLEQGPDGEMLDCSRCNSSETESENCIPIPIPEDDPYFPTHDENGDRRCMLFIKSIAGQSSLGYKNQVNQLTAYLDGSVIYGPTDCDSDSLRLFGRGQLNFTDLGPFNCQALPQGDQEQDCRSAPRFPCFVAGDQRNSHQPGLNTMHIIFLREHNRIANILSDLNPFWSDQTVFLETRRIVGAELAHIVFNEYLPILIGNDFMKSYDLFPRTHGYYNGYDSTCDASVSHAFATAAFRFGHSIVRRFFPRLDKDYKNISDPIDLSDNFNNVEAIYEAENGGSTSILMGLLGVPSMAFDRHVSTALRNHLFAIRGEPFSGLDLVALNIMRARDHGLQPYNEFRAFCGLPRAKSFDDLADEMDGSAIYALKTVYQSVNDIDIFPGLLAERPMKDALLPHTAACILAEQFQRTKRCDRFYYENNIEAIRFTPSQLDEIRKINLGSILCVNDNMLNKIQRDVFFLPVEPMNPIIPCGQFPAINLRKWKKKCYVGNQEILLGQSKRKSPCQVCTCTSEDLRCEAIFVGQCEKLFETYSFTDLLKDMACIVQCPSLFKKRNGRL